MTAVPRDNRVFANGPANGGLLVVLAVFLVCLIFSAVRTPVPAVNEPHYLSKAKHYWNPDYCRGDFFLEAPNAHVVFYQVVGLLTRWLTLEQTAWVARIVSLGLFAFGWCSLVGQLIPKRWAPFWTMCLYLSLVAVGQACRSIVTDGTPLRVLDLSGEWIVGGVEGKVFSYAFAFWAMGLWLAGKRYRSAVCAGLAISFHPVVGVWSVACGIFATLVTAIVRRKSTRVAGARRHVVVETAIVMVLLAVAALPGLIPAFQFVGGHEQKLESDAAFIQVAYRLAHHLDPMQIPLAAYVGYIALAACWFFVRRNAGLLPGERWFNAFVVASVLICLVGIALGWRDGTVGEMPNWQPRARLLKFYWFRLADVMIPIAACVGLVGLIPSRRSPEAGDSTAVAKHSGLSAWSISVALGALFTGSLLLPSPDASPSQYSPQQLADWQDACRWIAANTPDDAVFLTPAYSWGFKWYAGRPEFVTYKDVPQDAVGIVEWNNRLVALADWGRRSKAQFGNFSEAAVKNLRQECEKFQSGGIDYIVEVEGQFGPFALSPVYENETCRVYRVSNRQSQ